MSPITTPTARTIDRVALTLGLALRDARVRHSWALRELARRAGVTVATVHNVEAGRVASLETYARLASALGLRLDAAVLDPRRPAPARGGDPVHAAMGELEASTIGAHGSKIAIDEPYQHFQFAGRADVLAWDPAARALLHLENRTRFPNLQEAAGAFNAKRAYLGPAIATRLGLPPWRTETHVMVVAWTAETMRDIRRSEASIRAICPDPPIGFEAWWRGDPPTSGRRAELVVLDPGPAAGVGRKRRWVDLDRALSTTPRYRGYAALADLLEERQAGSGASR